MRLGSTNGSGTEDFRSVIDDLTVANKRLKLKLKKYERLYNDHLQEEKLFEVRFHGLPDHKKKELEDTLRRFASELDDGATTDYPQISSYAPALGQQKTASSTSQFAESGYASMSASGPNSSMPSHHPSNSADDRRKRSKSQYSRQQQSIQSYLHDIPLGLFPKSNASMTDKSKKKMVVRRLEQIFAGKGSVPGIHPQPIQQEEVAQLAANADRQEREATGQNFKPEGLRVARILYERDNVEEVDGPSQALQELRSNLHIGERDFASSGSPDQRPTRPLDLDPFRAQVPVENMNYIRHLGFTPPNMDTGAAPDDGHGWLYLNLLINMAQLHTLNVTPEYVKDALHEYSSHLELSRDGRKIRWKGGLDVTKHSSDSSTGCSPYDYYNDDGMSPLKRLETECSRDTNDTQLDPEQRARQLARAKRENERNKFAYTPMFFRKEESDEEEDLYDFDKDSGNSPQPLQPAGGSSGVGSSAVQNGPSLKKRRDDGPMIFYTKAKFCTDLSGDRLGASLIAPGAYSTVTSHPVGVPSPALSPSHGASAMTEPRGALDSTPIDVDSNSSSSSTGYFGFSPAPLQLDSGNNTPAFVDFKASGLGGVLPEDNFSIRVRRSQTQTSPSVPTTHHRSIAYPRQILDALGKRSSPGPTNSQHVIKEQLISASRQSLPSSTLPPASYLPFDSTSSGDGDSDLDSDASSEADSESGAGPATALQLLNMSPVRGHQYKGSDAESNEESEYSDDSDDGSIDLLATARQLDPNMVRTQEREYDAALADRLAEDIATGSSAANTGGGGGSGFNSPSDGAGVAAGTARVAGGRPSLAKLKRARTSDAMGLQAGAKGLKSLKTGE
jgi:hypothetical protein